MKKNIALALIVAGSLNVAHAADDDELLKLMGGGAVSTEEAELGEEIQAPKESALRKLVPSPSAEQNIFIQFFDNGEMEKALFQWPAAFVDSEFAKTATGRALNALLFFKNGAPVFGLERLLTVENPSQIAEPLKKMWEEAAPDNHAAWAHIAPKSWNEKWISVFGPIADVRIRSQGTFDGSQRNELAELIKKSPKNSRERAWLEWQAVLIQATEGDSGAAARVLSNLMKASVNPVSQELMTLTAARMLYQNGFLEASIKYYERVPKTSDDWFDAQEEMAWAMIRKGQPQDTIAVTQTLMSPMFVNLIGPEAVFVRSIALLKICDYPEVMNTFKAFNDRFKERAKNMMALSKESSTPEVKNLIERMKNGRVEAKTLGKDAGKLPRFATRDELLARMVRTEKALVTEAEKFSELYARSLSQGTAQVGFQARLEHVRKELDVRVQAARAAAYNRVKTLAEDEFNEIAVTLQKMHIVEAEVLQQISLADRVSGATSKSLLAEKKGTTGSRSKDRLVWPKEKEVWFDELANYRADVKKGCQSVTR